MIFAKRYIAILFIVILQISACANLGDSSTDIGGGYVYRVDGNDRWIRSDNIMKDGVYPNVIDYSCDKNYLIVIQKPTYQGYKRFLSQDLRYKYEVALTESLKNDADVKRFLQSHLWIDTGIHKKVAKEILRDNQASFENLDVIADSILKHDPFYKKHFSNKHNYWIIQKSSKQVYGPYSLEQYMLKRKELNIPQTLILKPEE